MKSRWIAIVAGLLFVTACTQIPTAELTQYKQAFSEAEGASNAVLVDFDQTLKLAKLASAPPPPASGAPYPPTLRVGGTTGSNTPEVDTVRLAWRTMARYNDTLTQLAEGKSVETVKSTAAGLVTSLAGFATAIAGTAVPGAGAIAGLAGQIGAELEKARLREEFVQALRKGAPLLERIYDTMIVLAGEHYKARFFLANKDRLLIVRDMRAQTKIVLLVTSTHAAPAQTAGLQGREAALNQKLLPAAADLAGHPFKLQPGATGKLPYTEVEDAAIVLALTELDRLSAACLANAKQMAALHEALDDYRNMLLKAKSALANLTAALDRPVDLTAEADDLLKLAFSVRSSLQAFQSELRAAR